MRNQTIKDSLKVIRFYDNKQKPCRFRWLRAASPLSWRNFCFWGNIAQVWCQFSKNFHGPPTFKIWQITVSSSMFLRIDWKLLSGNFIDSYQFRRQSSSLSRMTEGEKSSWEPWNRRLSHWFSRGTENTHMIGSFKLKVCLTLFSASAAHYKYARKEKLFAFRNFG